MNSALGIKRNGKTVLRSEAMIATNIGHSFRQSGKMLVLGKRNLYAAQMPEKGKPMDGDLTAVYEGKTWDWGSFVINILTIFLALPRRFMLSSYVDYTEFSEVLYEAIKLTLNTRTIFFDTVIIIIFSAFVCD